MHLVRECGCVLDLEKVSSCSRSSAAVQPNPESSDRSHHYSYSYRCSRYPGTLDWTSLRNDIISRNRRNLQNRNSAAAGIAIRFGPNVLLKCSVRKTGP
eukprot:COSAG01_NODE_60_length_29981_cov_23.262533_31_plen_99_part_00